MKIFPPIVDALCSEGKEQEEAIVKARENLKYLQEELKGKKFFAGKQIGFADIALRWLAHHENVFEEEAASMKLIAEAEFPLLSQWQKTLSDAPIFKENWPPKDKLVTKFQAIHEHELVKKLKKGAPK
ncbi:putative glutathione transferase [Rosa chinensis]|uniref:Putative glutathione transferase n=1 Tax=Rosa chinensis TaxID=74649 RepID=A0A2P6QSQ9_ROSCH|nr:putative glutathione transferase [Rosa chinensis]